MNVRCWCVAMFAISVSCPVAIAEQAVPATQSVANAAAGTTDPVQLSQPTADILKLSRAKVSDDVTVAFIQNGGQRFGLTANEIVYLRQQGVSDRVVAAMLNQQAQTATAAPPPPAAAPVADVTASAPQFIAPPAATPIVETAPVSMYVVSGAPAYYPVYDPWPYGYDPWPYWSPVLSFGFYWGWSDYDDDCHWGSSHHDKGKPSHRQDGKPLRSDGNPPPKGERPSSRGNSGGRGESGRLASNGRPSGGENRTGFNSAPTGPGSRNLGTASAAGPTSYWSNNRSQPGNSRANEIQANTAAARGRQGATPTSVWSSGDNNRTAAARPSGSSSAPQFARNGNSSSPAGVWNNSAKPATTSVAGPNRDASSFARSSRVSAAPTVAGNGSGSQPTGRYVANSALAYQRGSFSPGAGYRAAGGAASFSRPSMGSSSPSMRGASSFRSAGSFSSGGASRMSSGGGFRGGGGGGGGRR